MTSDTALDTFVSFNYQIDLIKHSVNAKTRQQILRLKWLKMCRDMSKIQGMQAILTYFKSTRVSNKKYGMMQHWRNWRSALLQNFNRRYFAMHQEKAQLVRVALAVKNVKANPIFSMVDYGFLLTNVNSTAVPIHDLSSCPDNNQHEHDIIERSINSPDVSNYKPVHLLSPKRSPKQSNSIKSPNSISASKTIQNTPHQNSVQERSIRQSPRPLSTSNNNGISLELPEKASISKVSAQSAATAKTANLSRNTRNASKISHNNSNISPIQSNLSPTSIISNVNNNTQNSVNISSLSTASNTPTSTMSPRKRSWRTIEEEEKMRLNESIKLQKAEEEKKRLFSDARMKKILIVATILTLVIVVTALYVASCFNSLKRQLKVHDDLMFAQLNARRAEAAEAATNVK
ncbi:hypothetical protein TRFO_14231 [Tritrichomonas foetus]|uniref:Uncharacterized protein n=1 Tax=Tritrichomonas foetus TaxID=1144522 RepID=A0A1J4KWR8_9EUKA|nr:hypothetical protein TRFO_14231 [Tritrichomonas foetus]|eukprot:OHT15320.1 hypothetical protein TRFO_14231 [Tritrichomonas foetus]